MITILAISLALAAADTIGPSDLTCSITVGDLTRDYLVHVPKAYDGKKPVPVVLIFHGGGSNAEQMVRFCGLNEKADQAGFIAVYPSGTARAEKLLTWNGGNCCGYYMTKTIFDVAFTRMLLDDLAKTVKIDEKRVFATGMSNGAIMAYRLASELSDRIAAIAPVSGPMGTEQCNPKRPVPVLHFHGTKDEFAPFKGGHGNKSISKTDFDSVDHSIKAWIKADGCKTEPKIDELPDTARDGTKVIRKTYGGGKDGAEVVLIVINGGGHTWPGEEPVLKLLGKSTKNISANDEMWEFLRNI